VVNSVFDKTFNHFVQLNYFEDIAFNYAGYLTAYSIFTKTKRQPNYFWSLEYCHSGEMLFAKNSEKLSALEGPEVFWMRPAHYYIYGSQPGKNRIHGWINCTGARAEKIISMLDQMFPVGHAPLSSKGDRFKNLFMETVDIINFRDHKKHHQAVWRLEEMVAILTDVYYERQEEHQAYLPINQLTEEIRQHPFAIWDFHGVAANQFKMSYSGFRKLFTRINGLPPHEFVIMQRIYHAMSLLRKPGMQIKNVAEQSGFEDFGSFSRLFKKKVGITPSAYKSHMPIQRRA